MKQPKITLGSVANIFSRMMHFENAGDTELGHTHKFDHLTLLGYGELEVTVDDKITVFKAPHMIYINAEKNHKLVALIDNTVAYCIHAVRNKDTLDIIDPSMVPKGIETKSLLPFANSA